MCFIYMLYYSFDLQSTQAWKLPVSFTTESSSYSYLRLKSFFFIITHFPSRNSLCGGKVSVERDSVRPPNPLS